jgi:hypothetical protein
VDTERDDHAVRSADTYSSGDAGTHQPIDGIAADTP